MRRLTESLGVKISAVVAFMLLSVVLMVSVAGTVVMVAGNSYVDDGDTLRRQMATTYLSENNEIVSNLYQTYLDAKENTNVYEGRLMSPQTEFRPQEWNYRFVICDAEGEVLMENGTCEAPLYERVDTFTFSSYRDEQRRTLMFNTANERDNYLDGYLNTHSGVNYMYDTVADESTGYEVRYLLILTTSVRSSYTVVVHGMVTPELTAHDTLFAQFYWLDRWMAIRTWFLPVGVVSLVLMVCLGVFLLCAAGHKEGVEGIHLNWVDRIPLDLYAALLFAVGLFFLQVVDSISYWLRAHLILSMIVCGCLLVMLWLLMALVLSVAARAKAGGFWRNTVIYRAGRLVWRAGRRLKEGARYVMASLPLVWKSVLVAVALGFASLLFVRANALLWWLIVTVVWMSAFLMASIGLQRLQKGSEDLAKGHLDTPIDTTHLRGDLLRAADTLNRIGDGMTKAVNERMKSERMKTELITNVSHDIKTPLTSIVNYVDLLKKEQPEGERVQEYLQVLDRQSERLKKLIEDLVEASKASSGTLSVHLEPCEAGILLTQVAGEYEERAAAQQLELRVSQPEDPVRIAADGRHLSRVLENLMNNICKYSLPATRVYLSLETQGSEAVITLRNISRVPLNLTGDELQERFVRGDSSRNTEGSGLGLSIARSLTELQHGRMEILVDGDLFKVNLYFPLCR